MLIKNLFCNYNAQELLLIASRLVFALCTGHINIIMEFIVVLLLVEKENVWHNIFQLIVLGLYDYTFTCSTNNYDTIPHHS
jgi:hypothetical protein